MSDSASVDLLQCIDVAKWYENGRVQALSGIDLSMKSGEIVALTGPSGCGKSTLLNIIGSLDTPTSGRVLFEGRELAQYHPFSQYRLHLVGFVFQNHHLISSMTLLENVELPLYPTIRSPKERRRRAVDLLKEMGLHDRMAFRPTRISTGERQRAAVARALVNRPRLLLCDEPTGSLDLHNGRVVLDHIFQISRKMDMAVIIVTHNPDVAALADRNMRIEDGHIFEKVVC